jgi:hypothetical protein
MTQTAHRPALNGVDVPALFATLDAVKGAPEIAGFQFRARNTWLSGTHNRTVIQGFYGAGQEDTSRTQPFSYDADHPHAAPLHRYAERNLRCRSRTCSARSGTGPATTRSGTTCVIARGRTGAGLTPRSASQPPSCCDEVAYTMRPSPAQPWAAAHIGQCSPEV